MGLLTATTWTAGSRSSSPVPDRSPCPRLFSRLGIAIGRRAPSFGPQTEPRPPCPVCLAWTPSSPPVRLAQHGFSEHARATPCSHQAWGSGRFPAKSRVVLVVVVLPLPLCLPACLPANHPHHHWSRLSFQVTRSRKQMPRCLVPIDIPSKGFSIPPADIGWE
ncbi:hypothetical protein VTJ83DRAFT_1586 [Remersonia thermophila]|uniref:Uncharacterized protein n=1 Tax=Remersonia thermophila TaxID=72144 RepID=A0ABR4DIM2_9PEZI